MNPFEILKKTPKTNCGQCGHPTCLAFAAAVSKSGEDPGKCPFIDLEGLSLPAGQGPGLDELARERDLALIQHLKSKIAALDFTAIAAPLGISPAMASEQSLQFDYLGQETLVHKQNGILLNGTPPEDPRDQILLYNYIASQGGNEPTKSWVGLESLPNSISKVKTLATYCEVRLAELFDNRDHDTLCAACAKLGGRIDSGASASLGLIVPVLPFVPQHILYWEAEPEDGFGAKVKVLFDHQVMDFLDLESLVFSAERMADRFAYFLN